MKPSRRELASRRRRRQAAIDKYKKQNKRCPWCSARITFSNRRNSFCNHSCAASFKNVERGRQSNIVCLRCFSIVKHQARFCSSRCRKEHAYETCIRKWKAGEINGGTKYGCLLVHVRRYIWNKKKPACWKCGWNKINKTTGKIPLEIDHIDGNCFNNAENNLRLLCPNCHALTPTYRALNKESNRKWRANYARKALSSNG